MEREKKWWLKLAIFYSFATVAKRVLCDEKPTLLELWTGGTASHIDNQN